MPRYSCPVSSPKDGVKLMVFGFFVGSMVLVPLEISLPSTRMLQAPSALLTMAIFLASSSADLLPLTSSDVTRQVPTYCWRSFLIAFSLAASPAAKRPLVATNAPRAQNTRVFMLFSKRTTMCLSALLRVVSGLLTGQRASHSQFFILHSSFFI